MKTVQEIATTVQDPANTWKTRHMGKTPPGVAQQVILSALGITANNHAHANAIFSALGIGVQARRVGRSSVPEVVLTTVGGYAFNREGEGEGGEYHPADGLDLSPIAQWMVAK